MLFSGWWIQSVKPTDEDKQIGLLLSKLPRRTPLVLAANKMDLIPAEVLNRNLEAYQASVKKEAQFHRHFCNAQSPSR